jgi:PAS domain S-box-containing protein
VPVKAESGEIVEWIGTTNDVEDRFQVAALELLRASDERRRLAESAARLAMWEWDLGDQFVWSAGLESLFGFKPEEARRADSLAALVDPRDRQRLMEALRAAADNRQGLSTEFRRIEPDGGPERWLHLRGSFLPPERSQPARVVGITMDITEIIETKEALAAALEESSEARALVDAVLDTTPTAVAIFDREMRFIRINNAGAAINGLPVEAHLGRRLVEVLPRVGPAAATRYREVWDSGEPMPTEEISGETPAQPGVSRWWDHSAAPVKNSAGEIVAVAVVFNEITTRKLAEQSLLESEQHMRFLSDVTKELIHFEDQEFLPLASQLAVPKLGDVCVISLDGQGFLPSTATAGVTGQIRKLIEGLDIETWQLRPDSGETISEVLERGEPAVNVQTTERWTKECAPSQEQRDLAKRIGLRSLICLPLLAQGQVTGRAIFAMTHSGRLHLAADIALAAEFTARVSLAVDNRRLLNELRVTAADLRRANAAKDDFLGMVSHELRTPLTVIKGNADVLQRLSDQLEAGARSKALADVSVEAARLQWLIENMLILARLDHGQTFELEPVLLPRIVQKVVKRRRKQQPERVIRVRSHAAAWPILAFGDYIEQVVNNMVSNADKYSPRDTPIEIVVKGAEDEVSVHVLDRGVGIAPTEEQQIFEPFYRSERTAARTGGMGLGLAVCKRVIEAQNGRLWARRRRGGGSDFGFALPARQVPSSGPAEDELE